MRKSFLNRLFVNSWGKKSEETKLNIKESQRGSVRSEAKEASSLTSAPREDILHGLFCEHKQYSVPEIAEITHPVCIAF